MQVIEGVKMHVWNHVEEAVVPDALRRMAPCHIMVDSHYILHAPVGYRLRVMLAVRAVLDTGLWPTI